MQLASLSGHDKGDWEWTGQFKRSTCDLEECSIQLLDPTILYSTHAGRDQMPTYGFQSAEMTAISVVLYGNIRSKIDSLPSVPWCKMFPYRMPNGRCYIFSTFPYINLVILCSGSFCFICEDEGSTHGTIQDQHRCLRCPSLRLDKSSASELVSHMGMHILHDSALKNVVNPCGFCLAPGSLCSVRLKKEQGKKVEMQIDMQNSRCQHNNQVRLSLTGFAKSTDSSPCTNIPITCPLSPAASNAVWKYNLEAHLKIIHPTANTSKYEALYEVSKSEFIALKNLYNSKP
jgi:hypothetical protein